MEQQIIHVDISSFAVSIARLKDSRLRGRPVIVAVPDMERSPIYAASYEAWKHGIKRGMPLQLARKMCRDIIPVSPDYDLYGRAMKAIMEILAHFSPTVEPIGYGHAYLDMTGSTRLFGAVKDSGLKIQREICSRLNLNSTVGVASNKLVSRIASSVIKPAGVQDVKIGYEQNFVAPLTVHYLPNINKKVRQQLLEFNLRLIRELAEISVQHLITAFGKKGLWLHQASHGIDNTPVQAPQSVPNVFEEQTLPDDSNDFNYLSSILYQMTEKAMFRLRRSAKAAKRFSIEIYYSDHKSAFGQKRLRSYSNSEYELFPHVELLFQKVLSRRIRVRRIAIRFFQLAPAVEQLSLFDTPDNVKQQQLTQAIDKIRKKFGQRAVQLVVV